MSYFADFVADGCSESQAAVTIGVCGWFHILAAQRSDYFYRREFNFVMSTRLPKKRILHLSAVCFFSLGLQRVALFTRMCIVRQRPWRWCSWWMGTG